MLTLTDPRQDRNCRGFNRRESLRIGGLALGGLTLAQLPAYRASAAFFRPGPLVMEG